MLDKNVDIVYRNARIKFDLDTEEWVAYMNTEKIYDIGTDEFKRNTSLRKLKEVIDRFNKKNFTPIPIIMFDGYGRMKTAEIISFTERPGECWILRDDDKKEKIRTIGDATTAPSHITKIYACENINNEPMVLNINSINEEIDKLENSIQRKKAERIHLIYNLQPFDISGLVIAPDEDIVI